MRFSTRAGETFEGYLTGPDGPAKVPAILVNSSILGVDQQMRELADAWAADGFVTLERAMLAEVEGDGRARQGYLGGGLARARAHRCDVPRRRDPAAAGERS